MLKEIDSICRKHGIRYYLAGGTCIGAIRHKGFLPWDDDMDIYMTRKEWERFMEVSKYDFPPDRVLLCPELVDTYSNLFGRYCDTSTTALHKHNMYVKNNEDDPCGVIVDILPLDPVPYSEEFMEEYGKKIALYSQLIMPTGGFVHRFLVDPFLYLKYSWKCMWNRKKVLKQLHEELFCYDEEQCDYYAMRWGGTPLLFPKEWFQEPTEYQFEDMVAMMPTMNNAYLTMHYGDNWVDVPNVKEREGHVAILRTDQPYEEFRRNYDTLVKHGRKIYVNLIQTAFHFARLLLAPKKEEQTRRGLQQEGQRILESMDCQSGAGLKRLQDMMEDYRLTEMTEILSPYLNKQLSAQYIGREDFPNILRFNHPVLVDVSDEFLEVVVLYCMHTNRIARALRLMEIKEKTGELNDTLKVYKEDILCFRSAVDDYDLHRYEECLKKVKTLNKKYDRWDALIKLEVRLYLYCGVGTEQRTQELLKLALQQFPEDGEYLWYQMKLDRRNGELQFETMAEQCCTAIQGTRNGVIQMEIREEMEACFESFVQRIREDVSAGEAEHAQEWLLMGKTFYTGDYLERLNILKSRIAILDLPEEQEKARFTRLAASLKVVFRAYRTSENLGSEWKQLYMELLSLCGYSPEAADVFFKVKTCQSYEELLAQREMFEDTEKMAEADMQMVYGDYLYALGKTKEAKEQFTKVLMSAQGAPMLQYQAEKRSGVKVIRRTVSV